MGEEARYHPLVCCSRARALGRCGNVRAERRSRVANHGGRRVPIGNGIELLVAPRAACGFEPVKATVVTRPMTTPVLECESEAERSPARQAHAVVYAAIPLWPSPDGNPSHAWECFQ